MHTQNVRLQHKILRVKGDYAISITIKIFQNMHSHLNLTHTAVQIYFQLTMRMFLLNYQIKKEMEHQDINQIGVNGLGGSSNGLCNGHLSGNENNGTTSISLKLYNTHPTHLKLFYFCQPSSKSRNFWDKATTR
jgi:hypothetical protein